MGIDISQLSPWAQQQVAKKMAQQMRAKAEKQKNKYNNVPTDRITSEGNTVKFPSAKEARRYDELMHLLQAGEISDLKLQHTFVLQDAYTTIEGKRVRAISYNADFTYYDSRNKFHVEDTKGGKATKTRVYALKKKLLLERYGYEIEEL